MGRPSKFDKLPAEIRQAIGGLRGSGHTIDQILAHLRTLGVEDIKRSSLGEHVKKLDQIGEDMRRDRAVADALVAKFGAEPDDKMFRLNVELMHGMLMKLNMAIRSGDASDIGAQDIMFLTSALKNIASAAKTDADRIEKIELRASAKAKREAADAAGSAMAERGMTRETIDAIKGRILGVRKG